MIRQGSSGPAILKVTMLNKGSDAYKPELFGNFITVERRIVNGGTSSYKLIGENKKLS